jgi:hypothetical protein
MSFKVRMPKQLKKPLSYLIAKLDNYIKISIHLRLMLRVKVSFLKRKENMMMIFNRMKRKSSHQCLHKFFSRRPR